MIVSRTPNGTVAVEIEVLDRGRCAVCDTNRTLELSCRRCGGKYMSIFRVENKLLIRRHILVENDFQSLLCEYQILRISSIILTGWKHLTQTSKYR
jgi:hypothetical protein